MHRTIVRVINEPANRHRVAATARAIRKCQSRALAIAEEADMDGRPGTARALRRKVAAPSATDIKVHHLAQRVRVTISAYGVDAVGEVRV